MSALVLVLSACGGDSPSPEGEDETEPEALPNPIFIEPAQGTASLAITRTADVSFLVTGISLGSTTLEIDGRDVGTLAERTRLGWLDSERLHLHMGGGMVPGRHTLQLVAPGLEEPKRSDLVTIDLVPQMAATPSVTASVSTGLRADALVVAGADEHGLLLLLDGDHADVLEARDAGWSLEPVRRFELPGLVRGPLDACLPSVLRIDDDGGDRVRIAWRVDLPGTHIDVLEAPLHGDTPGEIVTALDLDPEIVGVVEYAELGCPLLLPRVVLAELLAAVDTEQPRPGDRALVSATLLGDRLDPGRARRLVFEEPIDVDRPEPVLDLTTPAGLGATLVGARMGGIWPIVVEFDPTSGTAARRSGSDHPIPVLANVDRPLRVVSGAFGSRTIAALDRGSGRLALARIDDSSRRAPVVHELDGFTETPPGGNVAGTLVAGTPVFVVPMAEQPTVVVTMRSDAPVVRSLDVQCDAVALPHSRVANEGTSVGLACLLHDELHLVTLELD
jgi:hypothetical protein